MVNARLAMLTLMECVLEKTSYRSSSFQMNLLAAKDSNRHLRHRLRLRLRLRPTQIMVVVVVMVVVMVVVVVVVVVVVIIQNLL